MYDCGVNQGSCRVLCLSVFDKFVACANHAASPVCVDSSSGIASGMNLGRSASPSRTQHKIFNAMDLASHPKFRSTSILSRLPTPLWDVTYV